MRSPAGSRTSFTSGSASRSRGPEPELFRIRRPGSPAWRPGLDRRRRRDGRLGRSGIPALQDRLALLGEWDVDEVEVARDLGAREDLPRLVADLAAGVAG